ncbi:unnamed protein product [Lathyrus sativus]|nr:unnamed protein product [Lathyrus sativus]
MYGSRTFEEFDETISTTPVYRGCHGLFTFLLLMMKISCHFCVCLCSSRIVATWSFVAHVWLRFEQIWRD